MLSNRHEILFIYDVSWANPNGDPVNENMPRIDHETKRLYVRDARIKRTIRDTLLEMGEEIFLLSEQKEDGKKETKEERVKAFNGYKEIFERCIDIRLFGGVFALKNSKNKNSKNEDSSEKDAESKSFTGPVQFNYGQSLHRVKVEKVQGTSVMPSKEGKKQGTITETYVVPYALIAVYGIANEKVKESKLADKDLDKMLEALWIGHNCSTSILTTSKFGHMPRVLIDIVYKSVSLTVMGELDKLISIKSEIKDEEIRDISQLVLDFTNFSKKLQKYKNKIEKIRYIVDDRVTAEPAFEELFKDFSNVEILNFTK